MHRLQSIFYKVDLQLEYLETIGVHAWHGTNLSYSCRATLSNDEFKQDLDNRHIIYLISTSSH